MQNRNYSYRSQLYSFLLFTINVIFIYTFIYIQIFFTNNSIIIDKFYVNEKSDSYALIKT